MNNKWKIVLLLFLAFLPIQCKEQGTYQNVDLEKAASMEKELIIEAVNRLFIAVDNRDWKSVRSIFCDSVLLDYTSMVGGKPANLTPEQIVDSWKGTLPGFDKTHHQLGNYLVEHTDEKTEVFCYGTASHYLENDSKNNVWTVVGSYDLELRNIDEKWKVCKMKFNLKYMDGNMDLPKLAQERMKSSE